MNQNSITDDITGMFPGVETAENFGYTFFFYGAERKFPFATLASEDNEYDRVSNLDRPEVFRLNIGVSKQTFQELFGADKVDLTHYDFTALDTIMPHPVYAPQFFVCVLSPSEATIGKVQTLLAEAYGLSVSRHAKRNKNE